MVLLPCLLHPYYITFLHYFLSVQIKHSSVKKLKSRSNKNHKCNHFLPRDAMRKRGRCCRPGVCLSVCLSVTLVYYIQTAEDIVELLSRPGSPSFKFFDPRRRCPIPMPNLRPLQRGRKIQGWENFAIFDWNCRLSRKRYEIGPWLLWNINRKSHALYQMVTFSMTLTDPVF